MKHIQSLFPDISEIHFNYLHPSLLFQYSNLPMELDIYIPSLNLAFEYQGSYHFISNYHSNVAGTKWIYM